MKATDKVTVAITAGALVHLTNYIAKLPFGENLNKSWIEFSDACIVLGILNRGGTDFYFKDSRIKLNDEYSAEILDGKVKVGCQEFTFDAIKKLNKAIKKS